MDLRRTNYQYPRRRNTVETKIRAYSSIVKQLLISVMILGIIVAIRNYQNPTAKFIISNIKTSITHEVNLKNIYSNISTMVKKFIEELNKDLPDEITNTPVQNEGNTNSTANQQQTKPIENTKEATADDIDTNTDVPSEDTSIEPIATPVISSLDAMEIDISSIKKEYNLGVPVSGKITSGIGIRINPITHKQELHSGLDIEASRGAPIKACLAGDVSFAGKSSTYGNYVKIQTNDVTLIYAHCSKLYVKTGDKIKKGQKIATVGSTGLSTGNHLHLEIVKEGRIVDPEKIINIR